MTRIQGKKIAKQIEAQVKKRVATLKKQGTSTTLFVLLVGDDKPSHTYVKYKGLAAKRCGIDFKIFTLPQDATLEEILNTLKGMHSENPDGIIAQLPLPKHIDTNAVLNAIDTRIDVDCLTYENIGKMVMKEEGLIPPTPGAVLSILEHHNISLEGKNVTILGTGALVGRPLSVLCMNKRASVTTCNSITKDTKQKCLAADIIITGVGKKHVLTADMVSKGAVVIDTGVSFEDGKMYGDVDFEKVSKKALLVTPTPSGVGPITVARLLLNTIICAEARATTRRS